MAFPLTTQALQRQSRTVHCSFTTFSLFIVILFITMGVPKSPSSVPTKLALRRELEYGNRGLSKYAELTKRIREFPDTFSSSKGLSGRSLTDWKSPEHQDALGEMAGAFLEHRNNGSFFWPDYEPADQPGSLKYSVDREKIKDILHQMFWRQNDGSPRSANNLQIKTEESRPQISDGPGATFNDPIVIIDSNGDGPPPPNPSVRSGTRPQFRTLPGTPPDGVSMDRARHRVQSPLTNEMETNDDFSQENGSLDLGTYINRYASNNWTSPFREDASVAPYANMQPSIGHQRTDNSSPTRTTSSKRGKKRSATTGVNRASSRRSKMPRKYDQATPAQVEEAPRSPERSSVPEHAIAGAASASGAVPPGSPLTGVREEMDNPRITTESLADEGPADSAVGTTKLQNESEVREQKTSQNAERNTQLSLDKRKAPLYNSLGSLQPLSPAVPSSSSDVRHADQVTGTRSSEGQGTAPEPSPPRTARVEFRYRVISHYPVHLSVPWRSGRIRSKTLADLENELDLDASHTKVLRFSLKAPGSLAEHLVYRGREDEFNAMKQHFEDWIRKYIANKATGDRVLVQFEIEGLIDDDSLDRKPHEAAYDDGAGNFEW
ncbi:uncharacterized protein LY79DRAFT_549267 [Colletotrichum navitas]|uniref:Uncharacterized protein n=1 Tax=Colletotrichum navitas TaxID=681940 RepID=A0AAD8Q4E4_9PEZI|nr:uncharacterized protein LY79DRAFT_549267 [Colletotrichum navitas]KAK1594629.1 hypothetical protein LY79DRAFT_549267 [Colletotrichum navitas]